MLQRTTKVAAPTLIAALAALGAMPSADAKAPRSRDRTVAKGQTWLVTQTTHLHRLTVAPGATISAPAGSSVTLTVNGVETGQRITSTGGADTAIVAGTYRGDVVLTVSTANAVAWQGLSFPFRQGLYVNASGVDAHKSVLAALRGGRITSTEAKNLRINSTGEAFNGVYVAGGTYYLSKPQISLSGNGRSDFVGYGAAITATGGSRLVVDDAKVNNTGVVRTGVVADGGANLVVKNSTIATHDGTLPTGYQSTVDLAYMQQAPWMLGIIGNVRTTNLLGTNTTASYVNSKLSSTGWGVLSSDVGQNGKLTAINSRVTTSPEGYGAYAIGGVTEEFLGTSFDVGTYAAINRGGSVHFGDSTPAAVAALNASRAMGLSAAELCRLPAKASTINSARFGVMWHGPGSLLIDGHTTMTTGETAFLDKGQQVNVTVDGSQGASVVARNGVLFQVMEDDDPGPQMVNGKLLNTGVYHEPTGTPAKVATFDTTTAQTTDAHATFTNTTLNGNFYNAVRGNNPPGMFGPGMDGKNLDLTFAGTSVTGVITASTAKHKLDTITAADYKQMGEVTNTPSAAINNGVLVNLSGKSVWTLTGTSYLTKLTVGSNALVKAARGKSITMTVNGVPTTIQAGQTYTGQIVISLH